MDLSNYEGALWYAGATLVAYYSADIGVCKGCISADGKVKKALHGLTALFFQRAVWAVGRSVDWAYEAYYWRNAALGIGAGLAFNAWVLCLRRRREMAREPVPPPAPERQPGRRGRRARRN
ncbi:uncharacterized protein LOC120678623 [Panicum virgatum]|uniref:Uncharacterized protein n=1 Tax=Panicum virgatum TaxID=38727 RepID=A0A8T0R0Q1_PANVG|nr:uncharacterized protein LOC120678623 [Panicum virgatum]KAG2578719.1 hypothetical protein PVAP13_6NG123109 [Panicum virgatum]